MELDPELVAAGREHAAQHGFSHVEFVQRDASTTDAYAGAVPAELVLVCGVFGNVMDSDIRNTVEQIPTLCARGATVIWTRGRFEPDITPRIREWFVDAGFDELAFVPIPDTTAAVGANRLRADPLPFHAACRLFTFLERDRRPASIAKATQPFANHA